MNLSDKISSLSLDDPTPPTSKWQHWIYNCKDLPIHSDHYNYNRTNKKEECQFCKWIRRIRVKRSRIFDYKKVKSLQSFLPKSTFETNEIMRYIKEGDKFDSANSMEIFAENNKKGILPSQLVKPVFFNRKLGSAFFRDGITPNNKHPSNVLGGYFQLLLLGTTGNKELLEKFDKIFNKIFKMTANELEKGKQLANAINGIFIRCEINPDKEAYNDLSNLPFLIKIQIWIGNNWNQAMMKKELIDKIEHELGQMDELPKEMCHKFQYHLADPQRIRLWLYECRDRPKHRKCPGDECQICLEMSKHFDGKDYRIESSEHWKEYIKEDQLFQSPNMMAEIEKNKEKILPSFLAKSIFYNRKLGAALFRDGIEPSYEHPMNEGGGCYRFVFLGTTENEELLAKFNQIFHILIGGIANSPNKDSINGIFVRCECRPDAFKNAVGSNSITNLPFLIKMEVWIRDHFEYNDKIKLPLIDKFVEKLKKMDLPKPLYKFYMLNMNI